MLKFNNTCILIEHVILLHNKVISVFRKCQSKSIQSTVHSCVARDDL